MSRRSAGGYRAYSMDWLAASARLVFPHADQPLPTDHDFGLTIEPRGAVIDVGRGIVGRSHRSPDHRVSSDYWRNAGSRSVGRAARFLRGRERRVAQRYRDFRLPLTVPGPARPHWSEERYPVLLNALDCAHAILDFK